MLDHRAVDYVSVKISSVCSQLDVLCFDHEVERIAVRLRRLYRAANSYRPAKFVNLDMEEYRDLELTLAVFRRVLDEPAYARTDAGIVLQAYLPDSLPALEELCAWARARRDRTGAWVKVRLVKGANLAMEHVDAELHGWPAAPFGVGGHPSLDSWSQRPDRDRDARGHGAGGSLGGGGPYRGAAPLRPHC